jgi:hypothetical protein
MTAAPADSILAEFGIGASALIGSGRQSLVYALDDARVLRVFRRGGDMVALTRLKAFLADIDGRADIATPLIEKIDSAARFTVERRLPGTAMIALMPGLKGGRRRTALANYVAGADKIAAIDYRDRPYGHLLAPAPIRAGTWTEFLRRSLDRALMRNGAVIAAEVGDAEDLRARALALSEPLTPRPAKALVHGDYFPGNVLLDAALTVSGLVDFSAYHHGADLPGDDPRGDARRRRRRTPAGQRAPRRGGAAGGALLPRPRRLRDGRPGLCRRALPAALSLELGNAAATGEGRGGGLTGRIESRSGSMRASGRFTRRRTLAGRSGSAGRKTRTSP